MRPWPRTACRQSTQRTGGRPTIGAPLPVRTLRRPKVGHQARAYFCERRSITACGTGLAFIVPLAGSPWTQTRVSKPSTASAPSLNRRWCTLKLERRSAVTVVSIATRFGDEKARMGVDQRMPAEIIGLEIVVLAH